MTAVDRVPVDHKPVTTLDRRVCPGRRARVDVVVPFFNHGAFIEESVASARRQTHPVDRIIVVDDGSTDRHSLDILQQLEAAGSIEIIHQTNQGPSAARNRGINASTADAVLFLDGDDRLLEGYVESGLAALAAAEPLVGFAYPDQQCFGTLDHLAVMPPYNLYILANRNFAGTACLVDAAVFAEGHRFREDLRHGHEDWEFYLRLGLTGIRGVDFHDTPVHWRRWGYSRSDGINDRIGIYADEVRKLHPELFVPEQMIALKRRWSPALSIVLAGAQDSAEIVPAMARQTCGDYELVAAASDCLPRVRGRWVLVVDGSPGHIETARWLLGQADLVERALRVGLGLPQRCGLWLTAAQPTGTPVRWQRVEPGDPTSVIGVMVDGESYDQQASAGSSHLAREPTSATPFLADVFEATGIGAEWRWVGPSGRRPIRPLPAAGTDLATALPPPPEPPVRLDGELIDEDALAKVLKDSFEQERTARWAAQPLFLAADGVGCLPRPPAGFVDGLDALSGRAWATWVPNPTCGLDLVVDHAGRGLLEVVYDAAPGDRAALPPTGSRVRLGRLWTRKFPGTTALYARTDIYTHQVTYRVSDEPPRAEHEARLGYVATEPLSDMLSLAYRLELAVARLEPMFESLVAPVVDIPDPGAFLEPASRDSVPAETVVRGRLAPWLYGAGGLGNTLYELTLRDGRVRYATHPDACVGHPDVVRPVAVTIGELGPTRPDQPAATLEEVKDADGGGTAYVTGPANGSGQVAGPVLGTFSPDPGVSVPLVRLRPGLSSPTPPGEPGHRLAVDWKPLVNAGYVAEGVVGYVWQRDPNQAPLYCWDTEDGRERLLTLGEPPQGDRSRWHFRGTFGLAWQPHADRHGLVNLWELRLGDQVTYAIDPGEFEPMGFACTRVVARIPLRRRPGSIPLWRIGTVNEPRWRFTTCPDEGADDGFVRQGMICFLDPAHPQPIDDEPVDEAVPGPIPFGTPVYRVTDYHGRPLRPTSRLPVALDAVVEEVVGYLPPPGGPVPDEPSGTATPRAGKPVESPTSGGATTVLRRVTSRLPEPMRVTLRKARDEVRGRWRTSTR